MTDNKKENEVAAVAEAPVETAAASEAGCVAPHPSLIRVPSPSAWIATTRAPARR